MGSLIDIVFAFVRLCSFLFSLGVVIYVIASYRKPREVKVFSKVLSIIFTWCMLMVFMWITGNRIHTYVRIPVMMLGISIGFVRGWLIKFTTQGNNVYVHLAPLFVLGWGLSFVVVQAIAQLDALFGVYLCTLVYVLTTGTQIGIDFNLVIRKAFYKPADLAA